MIRMITAFNNRSLVFAFLSLFALAACAETKLLVHTAKTARGAKTPAPVVDDTPAPVADYPLPVGEYKVGKPYQIRGKWYYPTENFQYAETGIASWYGPNFHGKPTANGEIFDQNLATAAHRTLPLPSAVRVTNLENGRTISVRVNDRGPFARGRIIDLSRRSAQLLGFESNGTAKVRVEVLRDDSRRLKLAALNRESGAADRPQIASSPRQVVVATPLPNSGQPAQQPVQQPAQPPVQQPLQQMANTASTDTERFQPRVAAAEPRAAAEIPTLSEDVEILPVSPTGIYVQTGAFSKLENALRMRDRVYNLGPTQISRFSVAGIELYRVRIGPLHTVAVADTTLIKVTGAGVEDAQLVVE